jgi:CRP-like cAMP-binding protein
MPIRRVVPLVSMLWVAARLRGDSMGQTTDHRVDAREALRRLPLFSDVLGPGQLDELAAQCQPRVFRARSILMSQGDFGSSMFGILDGVASVAFVDAHERENAVATLSAAQVVGEMALMTGERRTATVVARTEVVALEITKPAVEQMFAKAPDLVESFAATLAIRRAMLDQIAADRSGLLRETIVRQMRKVFSNILAAAEGQETRAGISRSSSVSVKYGDGVISAHTLDRPGPS